jgi:uncharacterized tellurite resistance protein B-like protein
MKTPIKPESARDAAGALAADTLLLLRLVIGDGNPDLRARTLLRRVARQAFHLDDPAVDVLMPLVEGFGADDAERAANLFRQRPHEERIQLAVLLMTIAGKDKMLAAREERLRGRIAAILDLDETEFGPSPNTAEV